jgi:Bacterial regulatory helix-turn-helix protein, lysR family
MALSGHVPDLGALEVLLGVARAGSLNSAAQQIGVSQQAVSARIRAMEAQTGMPLVRRGPRVQPDPSGRGDRGVGGPAAGDRGRAGRRDRRGTVPVLRPPVRGTEELAAIGRSITGHEFLKRSHAPEPPFWAAVRSRSDTLVTRTDLDVRGVVASDSR